MLCVTTPIPSVLVAASSPMLFSKHERSFSIASCPSSCTVREPSLVLEAIPVFGYGMGMGPAGGEGGLRQTSGNAIGDLLSADLHEISRPLAKTLLDIGLTKNGETYGRAYALVTTG